MPCTVELACTEKELNAIYRFRYDIYVNEYNLDPPEADHTHKILKDALDEQCVSYALIEDGAVAGSLRLLYFSDALDLEPLIKKYDCRQAMDKFGVAAMCATSRFMLSPRLRNGKVVLKLMVTAYLDGCQRGVRFNYGDCSPHMLPFYEHMGYRRYTTAYNDSSYGYKLPILMLIRDQEHLSRIRSRLSRVAREYDDDSELRHWFKNNYPTYRDVISASFLSDDNFFELLTISVGTDPLHSLSILRNLSRKQAEQVLKSASVIQGKPGDKIIRQGEQDNTLYVILNGITEVLLDESPQAPIAILGAGDTFGELGLIAEIPRTASVIARSDCEMLVISGDFLEQFIQKEPAISATLLLNLSRILAKRLVVTTSQLARNSEYNENAMS